MKQERREALRKKAEAAFETLREEAIRKVLDAAQDKKTT